QETDDQMWDLGVSVEHHGRRTGNYASPAVGALWCRKCVETLGLLPQDRGAKDAPPLPDPQPTLEDMIREIARQEMAPEG
ncbi:MAG: hypothetical protein V3S68_05360, partial [Dehalococcoidia bacterium]